MPGSCPVEIFIFILLILSVSSLPANTLSANITETPPAGIPYGNTTINPFRHTNITLKPLQMEFTWNPTQITFLIEQSKSLFIGWINQLNVPVYTKLSITGHGKKIADMPQEANKIAFAAVTSQLSDNANDLALAILTGPVILTIF